MKVTKTQLIKEVRLAWNKTRIINGINIAVVGWHTNQYKIIENDETFKDVTRTSDHQPIKDFYYQADLVNYLYKCIN